MCLGSKEYSKRRRPMKTVLALILVGLILFFVAPKIALGESPSVVSADEVMAKIKLGLPVEYDNVVIKGNFDIRAVGLDCRADLAHPL